MATRLRPMHQDDVRTKIQTSQLINRLTDHALGENDVKLETSQVRAIEVLLRKTLPDLSAVGFDASEGMVNALASILSRIDGRTRTINPVHDPVP